MPSGSENERKSTGANRLPKLPGVSTDSVPLARRTHGPASGHGRAGGCSAQRMTGGSSPILQRRTSGSTTSLRKSSRSNQDSSFMLSHLNPPAAAVLRPRNAVSAASSTVGLLSSNRTTRQLPLAPHQLPLAPHQLPLAPHQLPLAPHQLPLAPHQLPVAATYRIQAPSTILPHSLDLSSSSSTSCSHDSSSCGLVGLRNLGNTCFMNSILQCLSRTHKLTDLLLSGRAVESKKPPKNGLVDAFIDLLQKMCSPAPHCSNTCLSPHMLKQRITKFAPRFQGYEQHDSQEFLRFMLAGLHDELNMATGTGAKSAPPSSHDTCSDADISWQQYLSIEHSKVSDLFVGQLKSTLTCQKCRNASVTFDPFWDLSLPIPKSSQAYGLRGIQLSKCLSLFMAQETLDGDNKPMCSHCKSPQTSSKQFTIQRFPEILVLHLKRFTGALYRTKLNAMINFPKVLDSSDLSPYSASKGLVGPYQLYAVSNHSGSTYAGHYTAYCSYHHNKWYTFNDSRYYAMTSDSVHTSEAYVLFYQRIS